MMNVTTYGLINPIQGVLTSAPWWLVGAVIISSAVLAGGPKPAAIAAVCLVLIVGLEMWEHSMATLTAVLVATAITLLIGLILGIMSARSDRFSAVLRRAPPGPAPHQGGAAARPAGAPGRGQPGDHPGPGDGRRRRPRGRRRARLRRRRRVRPARLLRGGPGRWFRDRGAGDPAGAGQAGGG